MGHGMHGMMGDDGREPSNGTDMHVNHKRMMMHLTFFWGKNAEILISGWPGTRSDMYALSLIVVFLLSVLTEWLSHCRLIKPGSPHVTAGLAQTALYAVRMGLAYMVMLAVMSFNVGVFVVAVAGHSLGFLLFGSRACKRSQPSMADLPPLKC